MSKGRVMHMANKDKLLILGAGGHGRAAAYIAANMKRWRQIAFLNDVEIPEMKDFKIIGGFNDIRHYQDEYDVFVAIGDNAIRESLLTKLEKEHATIPVLIHPSAQIGENVRMGAGTIVMAGAVIICNSTLGRGVILNTSSSVDHDNYIGDFVHISPGAHIAGGVTIGANTWVCIGATVIDHVTITDHCTIGAGAVVIKSIVERGTYVGVPARKLKG
jgi:sugar O-acyltransferase (sialic acid O-acetyltransferase NeuD family)